MIGKVRIPTQVPICPPWAGGYGVDRFGVLADLVWGEVIQRLRWIEPDTFQMGGGEKDSEAYNDEHPRHLVTIHHGFWMGDTPVTQQFYQAVTGENPSHFSGEDKGENPVEQVSWYDSNQFCKSVTEHLVPHGPWQVRLPFEAEWEFACRAETSGPRYSNALDEIAWYNRNSDATTHSVKEKLPNSWGLFDMLGNVYEWCKDQWHDTYNGAPDDGSAWVDATDEERNCVVRGGGWSDGAGGCRAAYRDRFDPGYRWLSQGLRLVLARRTGDGPA